MPKVYWIGRVDVRDAEAYKEYVAIGRPAYERNGAKFLARGGKIEVLEGQARARNVVVDFPSMEAALACYNSPEYTEARKIRQSISDGEFIVVEGIE